MMLAVWLLFVALLNLFPFHFPFVVTSVLTFAFLCIHAVSTWIHVSTCSCFYFTSISMEGHGKQPKNIPSKLEHFIHYPLLLFNLGSSSLYVCHPFHTLLTRFITCLIMSFFTTLTTWQLHFYSCCLPCLSKGTFAMCKETWNELRIWTQPKLIKKGCIVAPWCAGYLLFCMF